MSFLLLYVLLIFTEKELIEIMKKQSASTEDGSLQEELEITVIKKSKGCNSQEIKMKLPGETTFGTIIKFMHEEGLLKSKNAIVRPVHN